METLEVIQVEIGNGTIIDFIFTGEININNKVSITFKEKEHYFDIKSIKTKANGILYISAVETGLTRNYFNKMKEFDLRHIIGLKVTIIDDEEKIRKINKIGCLC